MRHLQEEICQTNPSNDGTTAIFRLPTARLHAFDHSAIDVAGPYSIIKDKMEGEGVDDKLPGKRWVLVIRCATVGAVHLEMIDTMDMALFLLAIEQFLAVRPRPTVFLADNGTNFHGRDNVLDGGQQSDPKGQEK
jgi:hypothetical protein